MVKIGDTIKVLDPNGFGDMVPIKGSFHVVRCVGEGEKVYIYEGYMVDGGARCLCGGHRWALEKEHYEIIKTNKSKMKTLNNYFKRLVDTDTQDLYKAGYINGDLELTEKGQKALNSITFFANKAELVKLAQEELEAEKETK